MKRAAIKETVEMTMTREERVKVIADNKLAIEKLQEATSELVSAEKADAKAAKKAAREEKRATRKAAREERRVERRTLKADKALRKAIETLVKNGKSIKLEDLIEEENSEE